MNADDWQPPHEWSPKVDEVVIDDRPNTRGARGVVLAVEIGGPHVGDRDYWIDVRWDGASSERHIASHWLYREDGTQ